MIPVVVLLHFVRIYLGTNNNNELAAVKYGATTNKLATVNPSTGAITAPTFQVTSNAVITYNATAVVII